MKMTRAGLWIYFYKLDNSNGLWRLVVRPEESYNFEYVLPQLPEQPIKIVVPLALQMGWVEIPSYFCTVIECARDLTQHLVYNKTSLPHHPIEELMTIPNVPPRSRADSPSKILQVYIGDFYNTATQSTDGQHLKKSGKQPSMG